MRKFLLYMIFLMLGGSASLFAQNKTISGTISDENGNRIPFATIKVKGRDLVAGAPKTIEITSTQINDALMDPLAEVVDAVRTALEKTPPELASDIVDNGIVLTGGGALLANLDVLLRERTGLPVSIAEDPLTCVVMGSGKVLDQLDLLSQLTID